MHILFADDVEEIGTLFAWQFAVYGHTTQIAMDGAEAVALVEQERFDAIVIDVGMTAMNGIEATRAIRALPNGQEVPIIVLTAHRESEYRHAALAAGANGVIYKPILPKVILDHIDDYRRR